jgi:2'-5' RNA ligase
MRLFVGLDLPEAVVSNLESFVAPLRSRARIQWSPLANLHVTTKFIGEWPEERLDEMKAGLAGVPLRAAIDVHVRRLGFFPNPHSPRVFFCGIDAAGLHELAADTDRATAALGVESEKRDYTPHLTLARIRETIDLQPLREAVAAQAMPDFGTFQASEFFLYKSVMRQGGSVYTKLAAFPLTK